MFGGIVRAALLLVLALPLCVHAQVYRWVDEKGKVHYGDRPIAKEVKSVPVLREAKPQESAPAPGMKAEEVRKVWGEPERTQKISTKAGEVLIWTYGRSKQVARGFVVKIEGGEVTEVVTDTGLDDARSAAPPRQPELQAGTGGSAEAEQRHQQEEARQQAVAKERRCAGMRESLQRIESQERRGGGAATMDRLREEKRQYGERMWSEGCGS
jgi:hypothetical protein